MKLLSNQLAPQKQIFPYIYYWSLGWDITYVLRMDKLFLFLNFIFFFIL